MIRLFRRVRWQQSNGAIVPADALEVRGQEEYLLEVWRDQQFDFSIHVSTPGTVLQRKKVVRRSGQVFVTTPRLASRLWVVSEDGELVFPNITQEEDGFYKYENGLGTRQALVNGYGVPVL